MATMKDTNPLLVESSHKEYRQSRQQQTNTRNKWIVFSSVICLLLTAIILFAYFAAFEEATNEESSSNDGLTFFEQRYLEIPSNDSCYALSQTLASDAHIAGEPNNFVLADIFANYLESWGYETYRDDISPVVLDHWIDSSLHINGIKINIANDNITNQADTNTPYRFAAWNAFSANGNKTGQLIYVNNAREEDFQFLQEEFGINFSSTEIEYIGLAKRQGNSRSNQANVTGHYGLKGLILFEDRNEPQNETYPNGPRLPDSGFMYGRIAYSAGCPGSPHPDRLQSVCGYNISNYDDLFPALKYDISMITVSSRTAIQLFEIMNEPSNFVESRCDYNYSSNWETNLGFTDGVDICIGATQNVMANLYTQNDHNMNDSIQNVYGYMEGSEYPDEIIMIGAHRDAWGLGACDDISGTVTILEIARSLAVLRDEYNWTSKRSIMFGSWDGEEWGLYGSVDFNEQTSDTNPWIDNIVAYLNFDMTVVGGRITLQGNPMMRELLMDAGKYVIYPYQKWTQFNRNPSEDPDYQFTVYDTWWNPEEGAANNLPLTATNSDFGGFEYYSGIPCVGAGFTGGGNAYTYHTFYDLNGWLDIVDPKWDFAKAIAEYGGLTLMKLIDHDVLPFDLTRLGDKLYEWATNDLPNYAEQRECDIDGTLAEMLVDIAMEFRENTQTFQGFVDVNTPNVNDMDADDVNMENINKINFVFKNIMRTMTLDPDDDEGDGLISNPWYNQLIWKPGSRYPLIWDTITSGCDSVDIETAFNLTIQYVNDAATFIQSAYQ